MATESQIRTYLIPDVPDRSCWQTQAMAGGDIGAAIAAGGRCLLRQFAHMAPQSVSAELLSIYNPQCQGGDRQSRWRLYLRIQTSDQGTAKYMDALVERGDLSHYYKFEKVTEPLVWPDSLAARCFIVRRQDLIEPLHGCDLNARIPDWYYTISPFAANEENNSLTLDRVLDRMDEPVVIRVRVQPMDVSAERRTLTDLLDRCHSINHGRDWEEDDDTRIDSLLDNHHGYSACRSRLSPLSRSDPIADDVVRSLRPIHESLCRDPQLFFSIDITAPTEAAAQTMAGVVGEEAFEDGRYRLIVSKKGEALFEVPAPAVRSSDLAPVPVYQYLPVEQGAEDYTGLARLIQSATVDELVGAFALPLASPSSPMLCIRRTTDPKHENPDELIIVGYNSQGLDSSSHPMAVGLLPEELRKHLGAFALSGAGKTTLNIHIVCQLHARGIPFMVMETSKTEFRVIKTFRTHKDPRLHQLGEDLEIYTPGDERCSPLRFNPLEIPPGIDRDVHIERLKECFAAFMPTFAALPSILGEALELCYERHPDPDSPPVVADLYAASLEVLSGRNYGGEVNANLAGALKTRLGDLTRLVPGKVFKCRRSVPGVEHLMRSFSVIELDRLSQDAKCLNVLCLLGAILEHLQVWPPAKGLRLVLLIEECHNVFGHSGEARPSEETPDPKAYVADLLSRLLVELRARGVGVILSDQHPSNLDPSALKSTSAKIAGAEVYGADREALAASMLLPDYQAQDLARLKPGEVYFFKEGLYRPLRIKTVNLHEQVDLTDFPTDADLVDRIKNDSWFRDTARAREGTELDQFKEALDILDRHRAAMAHKVTNLLAVYQILVGQKANPLRTQRLTGMVRHLRILKARLALCDKQFHQGPYRLFSYLLRTDHALTTRDLTAYADGLRRRYESGVQPGAQCLAGVIDRLIKNCMQLKMKETEDDQTR